MKGIYKNGEKACHCRKKDLFLILRELAQHGAVSIDGRNVDFHCGHGIAAIHAIESLNSFPCAFLRHPAVLQQALERVCPIFDLHVLQRLHIGDSALKIREDHCQRVRNTGLKVFAHVLDLDSLTSIVSYPERGEGGSNRYRGNCSPKLIEDLLGFFKPAEICDYMCGSGTTKAAADKMGVVSHLYDLHSGFDLMNSDIPERPEFIFWHPPYWDIIKYSGVMYNADEVKQRYGYDPTQHDLSCIATWDEFVSAMNFAMMKQFAALEKGGRMAVLMGDIKKKGRLYSMIAEIAKPGTLENIIIKAQHNCVSDRTQYSGRFIPILHEYVMIVRKDGALQYPVLLTARKKADIRDMRCATWRDVIAEVLQQYGHAVSLVEIYQSVESHRKAQSNKFWKEKVRQTLHRYSDSFRQDGDGTWMLCKGAA